MFRILTMSTFQLFHFIFLARTTNILLEKYMHMKKNNTYTYNHLHYHLTLLVNFCLTAILISALLDHFKAKLNSSNNLTTFSSALTSAHILTALLSFFKQLYNNNKRTQLI